MSLGMPRVSSFPATPASLLCPPARRPEGLEPFWMGSFTSCPATNWHDPHPLHSLETPEFQDLNFSSLSPIPYLLTTFIPVDLLSSPWNPLLSPSPSPPFWLYFLPSYPVLYQPPQPCACCHPAYPTPALSNTTVCFSGSHSWAL